MCELLGRGLFIMASKYSPYLLSNLRRGLIDCFDLNEFRSLCADLAIDYDIIIGESKEAKARELISYLDRRDRLIELLEYCALQRTTYPWPQVNNTHLNTIHQNKGSLVVLNITILFLAADPSDLSRLRLGTELREIQEQLLLAKYRDRFNLQQRMSIRPADISRALLDIFPQVVHFSGHGTAENAICVENSVGETHQIDSDALAALFEQFSGQVQCVLLNACYSEVQARAIARHIEYVVGMNQAIGDRAAIAFSTGFYQALGAGRKIEEAFQFGCVQIRLLGILEHLTPVLIRKEEA